MGTHHTACSIVQLLTQTKRPHFSRKRGKASKRERERLSQVQAKVSVLLPLPAGETMRMKYICKGGKANALGLGAGAA